MSVDTRRRRWKNRMLMEIVPVKPESANVEPSCGTVAGVNMVASPNDRLVCPFTWRDE